MNLNERRQEYAIQASKVYDLFTSDYMLVGDDRTMIFSRSGTIWGMVGDEEEAQVLGAWRFHDARIEVDLSQQQKRRTSGKQRKILARQRDQSYQPLHLILDQAPSQSIIVDGPLAGNYDLQRVPVPTVTLENDQDETAPMFESP